MRPVVHLLAVWTPHLPPALAEDDAGRLVVDDRPVRPLGGGTVRPVAAEAVLKLAHELLLPDAARTACMLLAERGRLARRHAQLCERADHARTSQPHVRAAEAPSRHEEVGHVARVDRTVGDPVAPVVRLAAGGEEVHAFLAVVVVQVHAPRAGGDGVRERTLLRHVLLAQHPVAHQPARLALPEQERTEVEYAVRVHFTFLCPRERTVDGEQQAVADRLAFLDHVAVDTVLPVPLAVHGLLALRERFGPWRLERHGRVAVRARPHERRAERVAVRRVGRERLVVLRLALASHAELRAGPEADPAVARGVHEERRREAHHLVVREVERLHGGDSAVRAFLHAERARREAHLQVGRLAHDLHPARVRLRERRLAVHERAAQLAHDVVPLLARAPHADLGGRVAAQYGTVLHEHRLEPAPRRGHGRARSGQAAAHHHEVRFHGLRHGLVLRRERPVRIFLALRQHHARAPSVEAREVVKRDRDGSGGQFHRAAALPGPFGGTRAKCLVEGLPVHEHREAAWRAVRPVARAHPHAVDAGRRHVSRGERVRHGHAQPVREQVGRAHHVHELRVEAPAACPESLRGNLHRCRRRNRTVDGHLDQSSQQDRFSFHGAMIADIPNRGNAKVTEPAYRLTSSFPGLTERRRRS